MHGLADDDVAIAYLEIEQACRIGAHPRLVMDWGSLITEVRERHQLACRALAAARKDDFHCSRLQWKSSVQMAWQQALARTMDSFQKSCKAAGTA